MDNRFITIEGLDGAGKTTITHRVSKYLNQYGVTDILTTHEPGGTPVSDFLRVLIKYGGPMNEPINSISELLMIYAARLQLIENVIKPALSKGYWVIGDRFDLSSQAYQGGGRGIDILLLHALSNKITNTLSPDLTFYLDISPELSISRINHRQKLDRIEQEPLSFFDRVRSCYKKLASERKNIITIDATQSLEEVSMSIYRHLDWWFLRPQE
ncbi:thymidylate kinase [Candidatus Blochmanniella pennsylvanica str. BPEN]|uniref:Thymidylate kinase n=1 Tax=Blochmanniella pennsylvanica (strain BPEN) TaxID=291272 RepID=KTHY_BLOPB|nr:dTMP kinase [Candidatus Blochmannia pennsylvanicus]Q492Q6.1 RecName: Full=Thymidylate kinase; AltName: Full=dTMP kinase [Candidatus Blochmannia pennsylvanicus str. BPEN]AAZ41037.1 thymidylate kinase [Candidatus Blochmannia pennsylvanicus str. BPEN]UOY04247.1 dTMP kinase [Candidatus Blochmannia pennsylvanicus]